MSTVENRRRIEEASLPLYHDKHYCPIRVGDTLNDRYRIVAKLGHGAYSTVWLSRDER